MFSVHAFESIQNIRALKFPDSMVRMVSYSTDHRSQLLLREEGIRAHDRMVDMFFEAQFFSELAQRSDISRSVRTVYETFLKGAVQPESVDEWMSFLVKDIYGKVTKHTFVFAVRGVELKAVGETQLGKLKLVASAQEFIESSNYTINVDLKNRVGDWFCNFNCFVGSVTGTFEAAKRQFTEQAELTAAMLAVEAGMTYERGSHYFHIAVVAKQQWKSEGSFYLHWSDEESCVGNTINFGGEHPLSFDALRVSALAESQTFNHAFSILQRNDRNDLEDAIALAVYWYGDAHRDQTNVMRFVKYWTCIECLLGGPGERISESLALGLAVVLGYGPFKPFLQSEFSLLKQQAKGLYAKRSKAVHRASHRHVSEANTVQLSQWAALAIFNAIFFAKAGMPSRAVLWKKIQEMDVDQAGQTVF